MKQFMKRFFLPFCMFLMLFSLSATAAPGKVNALKVTSSDNTITLKWSKVSKAKGYNIYLVNTANGTAKKYKSTTKTSYKITKATYNKTYTFKVCAYDKKKNEGAFSPVASVTVTPKKPSTPGSFQISALGNLSVSLKWNGVGKCNGGYIIQLYDETTKSYKDYKKIPSKYTKSITLKNLTADTTYQFRIVGVRVVGSQTIYSNPSKAVSAKVTKFSDAVKSVHAVRYEATIKRKVTVKTITTQKSIVLSKGTKITASTKAPGNVIGYLKNGTSFKIHTSYLKFTGLDCSKKNDYSKTTKEQFINAKGYRSRTNYLIWISQTKLKVNVFQKSGGKWKLVQVFPCVVGKWNTRTPNGTFEILKSQRYGDYGGPYLFFTPGKENGGTKENPKGCAFHNQTDSTMSKDASNGCCRLRLSNLIWLYNHCKVGTRVVSY